MRQAGAVLAVLAVVLGAAAGWAAEPCRFVVMGDNRPHWQGADIITPAPMYQRAIAEVNLLQPEFVVVVGDLIHGYDSDAALIRRQWEAFDQATKGFEMPVHLAAGNHDIWDKASEEVYQRRYGPLWYSFDVKDCHLVVLDSEDQSAPGQIAGKQLEWLRADLSGAKGKRVFVFLHTPVWGGSDEEFRASQWGREVHGLLAGAGVDTVFAGHWHQYLMMPTRDGVRYIITGGAGAELDDSPLTGGFYHYITVTAPPAGGGQARLAVIHTGSVDRQEVVTSESLATVRSFGSQLLLSGIAVEEEPTTVRRELRLRNPFPQAISGALEFAEAPGWAVTPPRLEFALAPGEGTTLAFSATVDPRQAEGALSYTIRLTVAGVGEARAERVLPLRRTAECPRVSGVQVDGALDEWTGEPTVRVDRKAQAVISPDLWGGPGTCSAVAWVGRDAANVYVAVRVTDPKLEPVPASGDVYLGDSTEVYVDGRAEGEMGRPAYGAGVVHLAIAPGAEGGPPQVQQHTADPEGWLPKGVEAASRRTGDGYAVEVAIPLSNLPQAGGLMGFDLALNDNSHPQGRVQLVWNGTADDWQDASAFGLIKTR